MSLCLAVLGACLPGWLKGTVGTHLTAEGGLRCHLPYVCPPFHFTVDCWDGPDGEPIVHHGYTLTSKILFKDVIETINKYAFIKNEYVCSLGAIHWSAPWHPCGGSL